MAVVIWLGLFAGALLAMEMVAYLAHRFIMHGPLWFLHRSHHVPHHRRFEANDLFAVLFAIPSIICIHQGVVHDRWLLLPIGLGMTGYGVVYFLFHDVIVHRRLKLRRLPRSAYLRRIIRAHMVHHRTHQRDGAESFGFLYAPSKFD